MSYEQSLYKIIEPIKHTTISRMNKGKKWRYGYNKEHDVIVISKTGQIGEIYEIQNLKIALPKPPKEVFKHEKNKWVRFENPKELKKLKNIFDWRDYPEEQKEKWYDYIDEEFKRREEGFWFKNNGVKLMLALQILERLTDCSLYSGRRVKLIKDVTVCVILKIDVLVFLL